MTDKAEGCRLHGTLRADVAPARKRLPLALVLIALAAMLISIAGVQKAQAGAVYPDDILKTIRTMGLDPVTEPVRRGDLYVLHALDPHGVEMRVVADVDFGEILSIVPAPILTNAYLAPILTSLYVPRAYAGPRIIHVPDQAGSK
ncbi:MAG TPA: hypothetical protein VFX37_07850 [Pseudolabrys sp.]|nr:hypothetical protein [Pseudolabrys sp.]